MFLFFLSSCAAAQPARQDAGVFFRTKIDKGAEVFTFDGFNLNKIVRDTEYIREKIPVTQGNYFTLFFVKEGCIPEAQVLQAGDKDIEIGEVILKRKADKDKGGLIGIIYKPVSGGRLIEHKGIFKIFKNEKINIIKDGVSYKITTDDKGIFVIEIPEGEYNIIFNDKSAGTVVIGKGRTSIKNLQKGQVLMD